MSLPDSRHPSTSGKTGNDQSGNAQPAMGPNVGPVEVGPINIGPPAGFNSPTNNFGWSAPLAPPGSILQKMRKKSFMEAAWLLAIVGIMQLAGGLVLLYQASYEASSASRFYSYSIAPSNPYEDYLTTYKMLKTIYGLQVVVAVVFLVLAYLVKHAPLKATAIGLGLYLAMNFGFAVLNPATLTQGLLFKIFCIGGLMRAVQCASKYEKFQKQSAAAAAR